MPAVPDSEFSVLEGDDGIRPAGPPDACFYCTRRVGQKHKGDCVTINRTVTYGVYRVRDDVRIGTFTTTDPAFWSARDCEFHKNESSWCKDNVDGGRGKYVGDALPAGEGCLCPSIYFKVEAMGTEITQPPPRTPERPILGAETTEPPRE